MSISALAGTSGAADRSGVYSVAAQAGGSGASSGDSSSSATTDATDYALTYSSPVVGMDAVTGAVVYLYRDATSGETLYQDPSRAALLYERSQTLSGSETAANTNADTGGQQAAQGDGRSDSGQPDRTAAAGERDGASPSAPTERQPRAEAGGGEQQAQQTQQSQAAQQRGFVPPTSWPSTAFA